VKAKGSLSGAFLVSLFQALRYFVLVVVLLMDLHVHEMVVVLFLVVLTIPSRRRTVKITADLS
jgi:hypothetical protein